MQEITINIQDPNTDARKARKITATITLKPNDKRDFIATSVETKTTTAPTLGAVTALSMGKNLQTGEVECIEIGSQIPGQMSLGDAVTADEIRGYDTSTGEIYDATPHNEKVIDLRQAQL